MIVKGGKHHNYESNTINNIEKDIIIRIGSGGSLQFPLLASGICFSEKDNVTGLAAFRQEGLSVRPVRMSK